MAGWLIGLPVPFLVMYAPTWSWIVFANARLGINQGLAWSVTIGILADLLGLGPAIAAVGGLIAISGIVAAAVMQETLVRVPSGSR